ncbi:uncharacterized protein HMPREF1541_09083 [Cyphellophora europaea CBS 101466]|uniref:TAFII28-like protein domain-containing protein n=1 Tax=Cyphellophora europaea (strain CBS 101466) TaxID=1220924 RepID=W2RKE4_CYPE1|nr:uncharacterized protein HMPREF1541_09083 [Cyphellophora europaea CBS 101466]ETN36805.1 hypothetical protein HMPREF1541_09083 [Cyphellophora europaea CBS 101466]
MATSPPSPFPPTLPNPKKRPSMSSQTSTTSAAKRRQLHPLRQTSFPAAVAGAYDSAITPSARSETGSIANSTFSATSSKVPGRGRGRPKKNAPLPADKDDTARSTTTKGGAAKSVVSGKSGARSEAGGDEDEDDDDEEVEVEITADEKKREEEEDTRRADRERMLASAFNEEQRTRYTQYRSWKIEPKNVRRIINQVMSQSSVDRVVSTVSWTSKLFAGLLVEGARDVQKEWAEAYDKTREEEKKWRRAELERLLLKREEGGMGEQEKVLVQRDIERLKKESEEYIPNPHRGGLLPDHLREALRRYKADGEGFGAGMQGSSHSLLGVPGSVAYRAGDGTTGRRLFR